jgi:hypothetical protein
MARIHSEVPDDLQSRLKEAAKQAKLPLREVIRRAGVQFLATLEPEPETEEAPPQVWSLPEGVDMGKLLARESEWRKLANKMNEAKEREQREERVGWSQ